MIIRNGNHLEKAMKNFSTILVSVI